MAKTIHTVVFQAQEGGGNPCPVTLEAGEMTAEQMQTMTRGFGQESAFLMKPSRFDCQIRVRYFVPLHEMEMCIHATIASVMVLVREGICRESPIVFETVLGSVPISWAYNGDRIDVSVEQFPAKYLNQNPTREEVCKVLRIQGEAMGQAPIQSAATSRFKLIVPLADKDILDTLKPDFEALWELCDRYGTTGFYPFAMERRKDETVFQGEAMGRPSVIYADVLLEDGHIIRTRVRGNAEILKK